MLCQPDRVGPLYKLLEEALLRNAGPASGKTKTWNRAGVIPEDIHEVGDDAWHPEGINVLGTPIGSGHFITQKMEERIENERDLWRAIPTVLDLQCSWQLLLQSANPQANHTMVLPLVLFTDGLHHVQIGRKKKTIIPGTSFSPLPHKPITPSQMALIVCGLNSAPSMLE